MGVPTVAAGASSAAPLAQNTAAGATSEAAGALNLEGHCKYLVTAVSGGSSIFIRCGGTGSSVAGSFAASKGALARVIWPGRSEPCSLTLLSAAFSRLWSL